MAPDNKTFTDKPDQLTDLGQAYYIRGNRLCLDITCPRCGARQVVRFTAGQLVGLDSLGIVFCPNPARCGESLSYGEFLGLQPEMIDPRHTRIADAFFSDSMLCINFVHRETSRQIKLALANLIKGGTVSFGGEKAARINGVKWNLGWRWWSHQAIQLESVTYN